ncbi:ragulator complex protein LAMTOR4-like [Styela clava]|uniref:ragulator complex protein LAMTOR4-like n=1 Tax=Styela clava TaxID=7725 RepID=UPI0019392959|nr:ragulator complex protein LAMTOR4-like [Styela clava]
MTSQIGVQKMVDNATQSLLQIPDQVGLLVLNESGGVISSHGDLSNDEQCANALMNMVNTAWKVQLGDKGKKQGNVARLSVIFEDYLFSATVSNGYIYIVKRQNRGPVTA